EATGGPAGSQFDESPNVPPSGFDHRADCPRALIAVSKTNSAEMVQRKLGGLREPIRRRIGGGLPSYDGFSCPERCEPTSKVGRSGRKNRRNRGEVHAKSGDSRED